MEKKNILVVDDDPDLVQLIAKLLQVSNYNVDIARNGAEALEKAKHNPHLILLDRTLPDMEGLEICRKIRDDHRLRRIPVIILSARDAAEDKIEGLYIGADDYVTKPFDSKELLARIDSVIRRSLLSQQAREDKDLLLVELNKILKGELITPFFQPIFSVKSFEPIGFEGLSRPPTDSMLSNPELLFQAALSFGMYFELETLCWGKAIAKWKESGKTNKLFLNCTPHFIESNKLKEDFFSQYGMLLSDVVLEITERTAIQDYALFMERLSSFKKAGLKIAVDDVGSGFASLDTVAQIKPDFVKIDMPLVREIHMDSLKRNIVEAIIGFCKKNEILTVAEGIEKEEEFKAVMELGIDAVQGYFLGRPNPDINCNFLPPKLRD